MRTSAERLLESRAELVALEFVDWDRYVDRGDEVRVFGWIAREDGARDFVILSFSDEGVGIFTSSAKHTRTIARRLHGESTGHADCERVESLFTEDRLPNVVRLEP